MDKNKRIKELVTISNELFDMVHESNNIQHKIRANELYDKIIKDNKTSDDTLNIIALENLDGDTIVRTSTSHDYVIVGKNYLVMKLDQNQELKHIEVPEYKYFMERMEAFEKLKRVSHEVVRNLILNIEA